MQEQPKNVEITKDSCPHGWANAKKCVLCEAVAPRSWMTLLPLKLGVCGDGQPAICSVDGGVVYPDILQRDVEFSKYACTAINNYWVMRRGLERAKIHLQHIRDFCVTKGADAAIDKINQTLDEFIYPALEHCEEEIVEN